MSDPLDELNSLFNAVRYFVRTFVLREGGSILRRDLLERLREEVPLRGPVREIILHYVIDWCTASVPRHPDWVMLKPDVIEDEAKIQAGITVDILGVLQAKHPAWITVESLFYSLGQGSYGSYLSRKVWEAVLRQLQWERTIEFADLPAGRCIRLKLGG